MLLATWAFQKILGGVALLMPNLKRLKEWAFAGFIFDVIFAFISGLAIESYADCIKAVIVFCILLMTYALFIKKELVRYNVNVGVDNYK